LTVRNFDGKIPKPGEFEELDVMLLSKAHLSIKAMENAIRALQPDKGLAEVMNVIRATNKYMEQTAPWTLAKEGKTERLATVLYTAIEVLRIAGSVLAPVMPEKMTKLLTCIGAPAESTFAELDSTGNSNPGTPIQDIDGLFPRIMVEKDVPAEAPKKAEKAAVVKEKKPEPVVPEGCITINDFFKTELRTAKVLEAEPVPQTEKLLKLQVEVGEEKRQIVAGISLYYKPEELIGKTIVIVANLMPAKLRGIESCGMLLAAKTEDSLKVVTIDAPDFPSGIKIG
jgi:methionyl-tRNA synthetase